MKRTKREFVPNVNRPLKLGEKFLVPCVSGVPIFWPPHNDPALGQVHAHAHPDPRFGDYPGSTRIFFSNGDYIKWKYLPVILEEIPKWVHTPSHLLHDAIRKIKCNHMIDGKCPHQGFNLKQVEPISGIITCPLHGMQFSAETGQGLTVPSQVLVPLRDMPFDDDNYWMYQ